MPPEVSVRQYSVKDSPAHFMHRKTDDEEKQSAQLFYRSTIQYLEEKMASWGDDGKSCLPM